MTTQVGTFLFLMSIRTRKHAKFLNVPNGGVLFRQGDPAKGCYIVVSGKVGFYAGGNSNTPRQPPTEMNETIPEAARRVKTYEGVRWMILRCRSGFFYILSICNKRRNYCEFRHVTSVSLFRSLIRWILVISCICCSTTTEEPPLY